MTGIGRGAVALAGSVQSELDRAAIVTETESLIRAFGGDGAPADLVSMAETLEEVAPGFSVGGGRLRLWAVELRSKARRG